MKDENKRKENEKKNREKRIFLSLYVRMSRKKNSCSNENNKKKYLVTLSISIHLFRSISPLFFLLASLFLLFSLLVYCFLFNIGENFFVGTITHIFLFSPFLSYILMVCLDEKKNGEERT